MLSNSLGTNLHMWDAQVAPFTRHFRLVRYDRRGHGKSGVTKGPYSMERLGRDALVAARSARHRTSQLVRPVDGRHGRAMGRRARAAQDRQAHPLQHLELLSRQAGVGRPHQARPRQGPRRRSSTPTWSGGSRRRFAKARRPRPRRSARCFSPPSPEGYIGCGEAIRDMDHRALLPKIKAPTLVIAGRHDPATPLEMNDFIRDQIPGAELACSKRHTSPTSSCPKLTTTPCSDFCCGSKRPWRWHGATRADRGIRAVWSRHAS